MAFGRVRALVRARATMKRSARVRAVVHGVRAKRAQKLAVVRTAQAVRAKKKAAVHKMKATRLSLR